MNKKIEEEQKYLADMNKKIEEERKHLEEEKKHLVYINKKIEDYCKEMDKKINYYREKINALNNSLENKKNEIILKINKSDDFINNEISEFYKLLNQNPENWEIYNSFCNCKRDLEYLKCCLEQQLNYPGINKEIINNILNQFNSLEKRIENIKAKDIKMNSKTHIPKGSNSINVYYINNFCRLWEDLITKIKEIKNLKKKFYKKINKSFTNLSCPNNDINNLEINFQNYENELISYKNPIKKAIISILNNNYNPAFSITAGNIENLLS